MPTVVFDIGNVLLDFRPWQYLEETFGAEAPLELYHRASFGSAQWDLLDRGVLTQDQAKEELQARYPYLRQELAQIFPGWFSSLRQLSGGVRALHAVKKQGIPVYALSNFHTEAFAYVRQTYSWFSLFDGWTISAHVGSLKPEARIYQHLLAEHAIAAGEAVFLDDSPANLQAAARFGLQGILVEDPEAIIPALQEHLGRELHP